ncbi:MAG: glycosyltransferase [Actinobacteria bacterium]|nr:glycosyltransferase [Actinomycetota bacterium]
MRDSLRVLVVSNMIPSLEVPQYGVFVARQTRALEQNGCTVEIVGLQKQATGKLGTARKYNGLRNRGAHAADRMQPDVVLAHYLTPTALMARRAAKAAHAPYVLVAHGGDVTHLERSKALRTSMRRAIRGADRIVAVSPALAERLEAVYPGLEIDVINTGVDRVLFRPGAADLSPYGAPPQRPLIVQIGNLIERKNPERLARAAQRLFAERGGGELWIAGSGPLEETLRGMSGVRLLGAVSPEQVPVLLRGADAAALVALSEGYGLGALEAVACGVPLVVSSTAPVARDLPETAAVRVDPTSEDAILDGLRAALSLPREDPAGQAKADAQADVVQARRMLDLLTAVAGRTA